MTVKEDNGVFIIVLTEAETVHYGVDRVLFDEHSKEAKQILKKLLKIAALKSEQPLSSSQFLIEIYPVFDGGCELVFVPKHDNGRKFKAVKKHRRQKGVSVKLKNGEEVLEVCLRLFRAGITAENRLFKVTDGYRLVLNTDRSKLSALGELSSNIIDSDIELARVLEYGVEICRNAVERIGITLDGR